MRAVQACASGNHMQPKKQVRRRLCDQELHLAAAELSDVGGVALLPVVTNWRAIRARCSICALMVMAVGLICARLLRLMAAHSSDDSQTPAMIGEGATRL